MQDATSCLVRRFTRDDGNGASSFSKRQLSALTSRAMRLASWLLPCMALSSRPTPLPLTSRFRFPSRRATTLLMSEADAKAAWLAKQQNPPGSQNVRNNLLGRTGDAKKIEAAAEAAQASAAEATANRALLAELKRQAVAAAQGSMGGPPPGVGGPMPDRGRPPPGRGGPPPGAMEIGNGSPMPGRKGEFRAQGGAGVGAFVPPPIGEERQGRSPGLQNNFYEVPSSEFRRAYGAAPPAPDAPYGAGAGVRGFGSPAQPPGGYGAEIPMPGMGRSPLGGPMPEMPGVEGPPPEMGGPPQGTGGPPPGMGRPQLGGPMPVSAAHDDGLQARMQQLERSNDRSDERYNERMQQLERSNERLQLALSGVREREEATREREEAARREVVELIAREEALSQRLAAIEARLAGGGNRWALDRGTASSTAGEALATGTTIADPSRMSLPEKVDMIQERLGLAPGGESLVAAVMEASEVAGVANEGGPLVVQVDRLMVKLFGRPGRG